MVIQVQSWVLYQSSMMWHLCKTSQSVITKVIWKVKFASCSTINSMALTKTVTLNQDHLKIVVAVKLHLRPWLVASTLMVRQTLQFWTTWPHVDNESNPPQIKKAGKWPISSPRQPTSQIGWILQASQLAVMQTRMSSSWKDELNQRFSGRYRMSPPASIA